jgi:outer membrane lipoprotein SlyB
MKKSFMKDSMSTIMDTAIGGATLSAVAGSGMGSGFKEATQIGISGAIAGRSYNRMKKWTK